MSVSRLPVLMVLHASTRSTVTSVFALRERLGLAVMRVSKANPCGVYNCLNNCIYKDWFNASFIQV